MLRFLRAQVVLVALALLPAAFFIAEGQPRKAGHRDVDSKSGGRKSGDAYLFAYFKGNGQDGLHLAYSTDGLTWSALNNDRSLLQPNVGKDKLMRDPHITEGPDGTFHMVWTSSWTDPVIGYAASKDLINWSEQRSIMPVTKEPLARNVWAPETFYDAKTKQYLLFWATTIPGRFPETDQTGDNNLNHRIYLTTTKDFKTFTPASLFYDHGFNVIDSTIVKDGSRYIMFLKDETKQPVAKKNLRYAVSSRAMGPYGQASAPITGNYWAEGPTAIKIGQRWIVYFDKYRDHRYGAVASGDLKQWEDISAQVRFPERARHGTVLRVRQSILSKLLELK
jgi:predicted GH43/DUF377 family glycosyl hydrolase